MNTILILSFAALAVPSLGLPYIINGDDVDDASRYPWQGSLRSRGRHICGCALISTTWAVTAAHCVGGTSFSVLFGSVNQTDTTGLGVEIRDVKQVIQHEDYGSGAGSFPNDIAVLKFDAIELSKNVSRIPITDKEQAGNTDCWISGWGLTEAGGGGKLPDILQEAHINVYTNSYCKGSWGSSINEGHVCIGDTENWRGSCNGDSGGPLVCKEGDNYELVGVTSWGINGCYTLFPSVYTRLTHFRSWITEKTGV